MVFRRILINDEEVYQPNDFEPKREHVYAAEYTTCTGRTIADVIGWRYSDMTLTWDTLPQGMLETLIKMSGVCTMTFVDVDNTEVTEEIRPISNVCIGTRYKAYDGDPLWKDVSVEVSFINVHN
jgi:hypothetical protein